MKVLLVNGSPHEKGCVYTALTEIADTLKSEGLDSEIFWIGNRPVQGCIGCWQCREKGTCAFQDELYTGFIEKMKNSDGIIIGSPVYYAGPNGSLCALLDRVFFSGSEFLRRKPGACVVNCRRGGSSAAFDRLNKYFTILQMPVVSSQYWNSTHGTTPEEVKEDEEGLQTMRTLARNMAYLLKSNAVSGIGLPPSEPLLRTNFIR
jgi:multimeric flavodoxin WrbA